MELFTPILNTFNIKNFEIIIKNVNKFEQKPFILVSFNNKIFSNNVQDNFILSLLKNKKIENFIVIEPSSEKELLEILLSNNKLIHAVEFFCKIVDKKIDINKFLSNLYYEKYDEYFSKLKFINFKDELNNFIFLSDDILRIINKSITEEENYRIIVYRIFENISNNITFLFKKYFSYLIDRESLQPYFNAFLLRLVKIEKQRGKPLAKHDIEKQLRYFRDKELNKSLVNYIDIIEVMNEI